MKKGIEKEFRKYGKIIESDSFNFFCLVNSIYYAKIADAENHALQCMDECNLGHPEVSNKPCLSRHGETQRLLDFTKSAKQKRRQTFS